MVSDTRDLDVVIVGAGISGIDGGYHLQTACPDKTYAILEARDRLGGTWDLFRYPGIRSDSDMFTLGFPFRPWSSARSIAGGGDILRYVEDTARAFGIDRTIRYRHAVESASWSSEDARWTLEVRTDGGLVRYTCRFLYACAGYYDYERPYTPDLPGRERFRGRILHPQLWDPDLDYTNQRVVVIGSGATAMTLVPALADRAAHVTMLQRSPTYILSMPAVDRTAANLMRWMSPPRAAAIARWKSITLGMALYSFCRRFPDRAKDLLVKGVARELDGASDLANFVPDYNPWDQRLCLVPDSDLFVAIKSGRVSVVTDRIATFDETGIALTSGTHLPADIVITATGLRLKFLGGIEVEVDGKTIEASSSMVYKGMLLSDVPNLAFAAGYTNASWTLKCDLTSRFVCRLLRHMDARGYTKACARRDPAVVPEPLFDFTSGYVQRALAFMPTQGDVRPWRLYQNYALDLAVMRYQPIANPNLELS